MNVFFRALFFCGLGRHAQGIDEAPLKSLTELLFAQYPAGARRGNRISTISQGRAGVTGLERKNAVMSEDMGDGMGLGDLNDIMDAAVDADGGEVDTKKFDVKELAGITPPLGFFDPVGFTEDASEGKIRFYREVEIKHGRLGMVAALGFLVAEQFHPLFGGNIDVPSYLAFQQTPLQTFWGAVLFAISILEVFSVFSFNTPFGGEPWTIRSDHEPGNLGWDPLNLKPTDPKALKEMQTKELNNGRLAMLAAAGMIAQEFVTGQKLFS
jgi:hypothetical protein